jgi:hypothetical protein
MAEPIKGLPWTFPITLDSVLNSGFQVNPTLSAGDFQISLDGSAFSNLATLPVVSPAGSAQVLISLSGAERDADVALLLAVDQAGDEWEQLAVQMDIPVSTSETAVDLLEGDHIETSSSLIINKKGTTTPVLSKTITGSLLPVTVTIRTLDT